MGSTAMRSEQDVQDRYRGCMLGLAIGDALGFPVEFRSLADIRTSYGPHGITGFIEGSHPPGTFSDDTQMSVALAEGLLEAGECGTEALMATVAERFVDWSESPQNDRAPGTTCTAACAQLAAGVHWREAGRNDSKGCGTAMRAAPVGLYYHGRTERLIEVAEAQSLCTHGHPCATAGSVAVALGVSLALEGRASGEWTRALCRAARRYDAGFADRLILCEHLLNQGADVALERIGPGWVAEEAVAAALHCVLRHPDDYRAAVLLAANTEGDSDSIACIAGALSGARNGLRAIPQEWAQRVEARDRLLQLADRLYAAVTVAAG